MAAKKKAAAKKAASKRIPFTYAVVASGTRSVVADVEAIVLEGVLHFLDDKGVVQAFATGAWSSVERIEAPKVD